MIWLLLPVITNEPFKFYLSLLVNYIIMRGFVFTHSEFLVILLTILAMVVGTLIVLNIMEEKYITSDDCLARGGEVCRGIYTCPGEASARMEPGKESPRIGLIKEGTSVYLCCREGCKK